MSHVFISKVDITMSFLHRGAKDGGIVGIIVENEHINGLQITFNYGFSVFNVCCGPRSILTPSTSRRSGH